LTLPLFYPFETDSRPSQAEVMQKVIRSLKNGKHVVLEAPNGFGKTVTALAAGLEVVQGDRDAKLFYSSRTHKQMDHVVEEVVKISAASGKTVPAVSLRGKAEMCINDEVNRLSFGDSGVLNRICNIKRAQKACPYTKKVFHVSSSLKGKVLDAPTIKKVCKTKGACPYYVARELVKSSRVVAHSYQYLLDPSLGVVDDYEENSILIVDECHNLPEEAKEAMSDILYDSTISDSLKEASRMGDARVLDALVEFKAKCQEYSKRAAASSEGILRLELSELVSDTAWLNLGECLADYAELFKKRYDDLVVQPNPKSSGLERIGHVLRLTQHVDKVFELGGYNDESVGAYYVAPNENENTHAFTLRCFKPWMATAPRIKLFRTTIHMSGTVSPAENYRFSVGIPKDKWLFIDAGNPYRDGQLKVLFVKGVFSKFDMRSDPANISKINRLLRTCILNCKGNTGIFPASNSFLGKIGVKNLKRFCSEAGKTLYLDTPTVITSSAKSDDVVNEFRRDGNGVLVSVQWGRTSEGTDFKGDEMTTSIVVGMPYAKTGKIIRDEIKAAGPDGYVTQYLIPAVRRATQAMGRAIRGPEDRGLIIGLEDSFCRPIVLRFMPKWITSNMTIIDKSDSEEQLKNEINGFR
jgi:DNA excision repair protein ERCC-2